MIQCQFCSQSLRSAIWICPMSVSCGHLGAACGLRDWGVRGSDSYTSSLGVGPEFVSNFMGLLFWDSSSPHCPWGFPVPWGSLFGSSASSWGFSNSLHHVLLHPHLVWRPMLGGATGCFFHLVFSPACLLLFSSHNTRVLSGVRASWCAASGDGATTPCISSRIRATFSRRQAGVCCFLSPGAGTDVFRWRSPPFLCFPALALEFVLSVLC